MSRVGIGYSLSIDLVTLVDNRVFPGEWDCPGTVYKEGLEQSTGRAWNSLQGGPGTVYREGLEQSTGRAWNSLQARIRCPDCCVIGVCGLDYTKPARCQ